MTDEQLMQQIAAGDQAAFAKLFDRHSPIVLGVLIKLVGQRQEAEELLQETFWRVWDKAHTFKPERASLRTWLFSIARRKAIDWLRRRGARPQSTEGDSTAEESPLMQMADAADVVADVLSGQQRSALQVAIADLPAEQQEVIQLAYFAGKTRREIAAETELPLGTVHTRVRLALLHMRGALAVQGWER